MQQTMDAIKHYLDTHPNCGWNELKAALDYTMYSSMFQAVRQLERDGYLKRTPVHTADGSNVLLEKL